MTSLPHRCACMVGIGETRYARLGAVPAAIERHASTATPRAKKLTQAILARAFRGELVGTEAELARREGRDYEPAAVLLQRIRAERAAHEPSPRPSPRGRGSRVGRLQPPRGKAQG